MKINCDYVIVKVSSEVEEFCGTIKNDAGEEIKLILNASWRPTHNAKIAAEVLAVPEYLSGRDVLYERPQGSPKPSSYRGHDRLWKEVMTLPPKYRKNHNFRYSCGYGVPDVQTLEGVPVEVQVGDTVYFHYNTLLNAENYWKRDDDGQLIYKVPYSSIFCYVRGEGTDPVPINGYCLVTPYYDEDVDEIEVNGHYIFGKLKGNLVVSTDVKPKYLTGVLRHVGAKIGTDTRDLLPGDLITYRPSSEFVNRIEGLDYYVMRTWDIVAVWMTDKEVKKHTEIAASKGWKLEFDQIVPVGDYVMLSPDEKIVGQSVRTVLVDPNNPHQKVNPGEILVIGHDLKRKNFKNAIGHVIGQGELCKTNRKGQKVIYEKSSYYMYVEEFNVVFVRAGDIYGQVLDSNDKIV